MSDNSIRNLPPNEQAARRAAWRDAQRIHHAQKRSRRTGVPVEADPELRLMKVWQELRAVATLLRETVDRRPARFMDMLQESLPRLKAAHTNLRLGSEAAMLLGLIIEIIELLKRRQI